MQNQKKGPSILQQMRLLLFAAAALLGTVQYAGAAVVTNWIAYNDHVPGPLPDPLVNSGWGTAPNVTRYNLRGLTDNPPEPTFGTLTNFQTGLGISATIIATATGAPDYFGSIGYPNAGTPAFNLFNGKVDLGNVNSAIGIRSSANSTVTLTFSNLNPALLYRFRGTAVRGNNYLDRWTLASIRGAVSYTDAHSPAGVYTMNNFPSGGMTNGQAAYNSGENRTDGAMIGWDDIAPQADGTFFVKCEQYVANPLPNALAPNLGAYGYAFAGIMLAEVGEPTPPVIVTEPPAVLNMEQNRTLTLSVTAQGAPAPSYQWYKEGVGALPGETARTYSKPLAQPADSGNYYVIVSNTLNAVTSIVSVVTVQPDTTGPTLLSLKGDDTFQKITITWDETVFQDPAGEVGSYIIYDPSHNQVDVNSVDYRSNSVVLHVATMLADTDYSIEIDYQQDLAGNPTLTVGTPDVENGIATNFHTFAITRGFTRFQAYLGLPSGGTIAQFVTSPAYPDGATFGFYTNLLYWPQSVPNLEQYAMRFTGLFVASETGVHHFDPANDDEVRLRIYPGEDSTSVPAELVGTAVTGLTGGPTLDVDLVAGDRYFYELIVRELGGGDLAGLAVTLPSGAVSSPISAQYLAAAADVASAPNAGIAQQPQNRTTSDNHSAIFTVAVTNAGGSVSYQWQLSTGGAFSDVTNGNNASYTTPLQSLANDGNQYRVLVTVPGRSITSSVATLSVIDDTIPPQVVSVHGGRNLNTVTVFFDEAMDPGAVGESSNYELRDSSDLVLDLSSPVLSADNRSVTFTTSPQTAGALYTMHAQDVSDVAGNALAPTDVTFQTWTYSRGFVMKELYLGLSSSTVAISELRNSPKYPNSPDLVRYGDTPELNTFDEFEGYGARLSGVLIPPANGNYTFYISSDDNGELWLSTDNDPAHIANIANEPVYAGRRVWTGESAGGSRLTTPSPSGGPQANISGPIPLVAGQMYYFEALMKEGGGGDNLAVAWQIPGGSAPVNGTLSLGSTSFAALADPVGAVITITQQPSSLTATQGQIGSFTVTALGTNVNGSASVAYQWQKSIGGVFTDIPGASSFNYVTAALTAGDSGSQYRALIFIPGATATSSVATVTVGGASPTLRSTIVGGIISLSWDAPARLQFATSLTEPIDWQDVDTGGATSYTVDPASQFVVNLDPAQAGGGGRTGTGSGTVNLSGNTLAVNVTYSGLSGARSDDHFHAPAARGASAGVVYGLSAITTGTTSGIISGNITLVDGAYGGKAIAAQIQDLRDGLWYLNIHTATFGGGEIRGQVDPSSARFYRLISP